MNYNENERWEKIPVNHDVFFGPWRRYVKDENGNWKDVTTPADSFNGP